MECDDLVALNPRASPRRSLPPDRVRTSQQAPKDAASERGSRTARATAKPSRSRPSRCRARLPHRARRAAAPTRDGAASAGGRQAVAKTSPGARSTGTAARRHSATPGAARAEAAADPASARPRRPRDRSPGMTVRAVDAGAARALRAQPRTAAVALVRVGIDVDHHAALVAQAARVRSSADAQDRRPPSGPRGTARRRPARSRGSRRKRRESHAACPRGRTARRCVMRRRAATAGRCRGCRVLPDDADAGPMRSASRCVRDVDPRPRGCAPSSAVVGPAGVREPRPEVPELGSLARSCARGNELLREHVADERPAPVSLDAVPDANACVQGLATDRLHRVARSSETRRLRGTGVYAPRPGRAPGRGRRPGGGGTDLRDGQPYPGANRHLDGRSAGAREPVSSPRRPNAPVHITMRDPRLPRHRDPAQPARTSWGRRPARAGGAGGRARRRQRRLSPTDTPAVPVTPVPASEPAPARPGRPRRTDRRDGRDAGDAVRDSPAEPAAPWPCSARTRSADG